MHAYRGVLPWIVVLGLLVAGAPQPAPAAELTKFQEDRAVEATKGRQLTPYLDRWKTSDTESVFKDPNLQSKYQGDLPFYRDWLFLNLEFVADGFYKHRTNPDFRRGDKTQSFHSDNDFRRFVSLYGFELRNADDVFKPATWRARFIGAADVDTDFNAKDETENTHVALQEAFLEHQIFDLGELDLSFLRVGIEPFKSDFHGLLFFDNAISARVFGEYNHNKYRYNLAVFRPIEKDVHSNLNDLTQGLKNQWIGLASLAVNDVTPGWNGEFSFHVNSDRNNGAELDTYYAGSTFNGTLGPVAFNPAAYVVFGDNKVKQATGGRAEKDITGGLALLDVAYTLPSADFVTIRGGYLFQSGDSDAKDKTQSGFQAINDNVALFGAGGSYWVGEAIFFNQLGQRNGGTQLVKTNSFLTEPGNFNSPGLHLLNVGTFLKVTQRLDAIFNLNYMMFAETGAIESQVGRNVDQSIGFDLNGLVEWRPLQQKAFVVDLAQSVLFPGGGFRDAVGDSTTQFATTLDVRFIY
jgi:hypothetical protein